MPPRRTAGTSVGRSRKRVNCPWASQPPARRRRAMRPAVASWDATSCRLGPAPDCSLPHFTARIDTRAPRLDVSLTSGWPTRRAGLTTESLFHDAQARAPLRRHARLHELLVILVREGVEPLLQRPVRFDHPNGLGKRCNPVIHLFARLAM